ncbi:hypothetical protein [Orrella sp. 11846]|uniref:hypothetical protein n=1 Tax=Orrella sp. 11846 TaxID=3409913 RepID=UPI003B58C5F8
MIWTNDDLEALYLDICRDMSVEKTYREKLYLTANRSKNPTELAALGLFLAKSKKLNLSHKVASCVVFIYKCIEQEQVDVLQNNFCFIEHLEADIFRSINYSEEFKATKDDYRQVYLSILTAKWHAEIFLQKNPIKTYEKVISFAKNIISTRNRITLSQNIGSCLLVYAYFLFSQGDFNHAREVINFLWKFYCNSVKLLDEEVFPASQHMGDLARFSVMAKSACVGREWIDNKPKRENFWNARRVMSITSRVKLIDDNLFCKNFEIFLSNK